VIRFFGKNAERILTITLYYVIGPLLALLYGFEITENAQALTHPAAAKAIYLPRIILGATGILLTALGIMKLVKLKTRNRE
jgi:hypothetical protein